MPWTDLITVAGDLGGTAFALVASVIINFALLGLVWKMFADSSKRNLESAKSDTALALAIQDISASHREAVAQLTSADTVSQSAIRRVEDAVAALERQTPNVCRMGRDAA